MPGTGQQHPDSLGRHALGLSAEAPKAGPELQASWKADADLRACGLEGRARHRAWHAWEDAGQARRVLYRTWDAWEQTTREAIRRFYVAQPHCAQEQKCHSCLWTGIPRSAQRCDRCGTRHTMGLVMARPLGHSRKAPPITAGLPSQVFASPEDREAATTSALLDLQFIYCCACDFWLNRQEQFDIHVLTPRHICITRVTEAWEGMVRDRMEVRDRAVRTLQGRPRRSGRGPDGPGGAPVRFGIYVDLNNALNGDRMGIYRRDDPVRHRLAFPESTHVATILESSLLWARLATDEEQGHTGRWCHFLPEFRPRRVLFGDGREALESEMLRDGPEPITVLGWH